MKTVQVAIKDPEYAESIRSLLSCDGSHRVHLVDRPDLNLGGVIVIDAARLDGRSVPANDQQRLVVMVRKEHDNLVKIWNAGVRHVVFHGDPPHATSIVVLGVELSLACVISPNHSDPLPSLESGGGTKRGRCRTRTASPSR